ncbi:hypothetical protein BGX38DRAFT_1274625 [Terfezia claveryi]|nr:hypothetical protein BGX38DRAFT_1274625 [Terfezia claveryi]
MSSAKVRVRLGPKAKSTALQPRSLTSLNVRKPKKVNRDEGVDMASEWVDENVSKVSKKSRKTQKKTGHGTRWVSEQLGVSRSMLQAWIKQEDKIVGLQKGSRNVERA